MTRSERLTQLLEELGRAGNCELSIDDGQEPEQYALMERDAGPADNGGPWWMTGDDPIELIRASINQEYPEDWPAERVYDLDTGKAYGIDYEPSIYELD